MITARMSRPIKVLVVSGAAIAVAVLASACGTQRISVPSSDPTHAGAVIFSQRCAGCHTLSYAGTRGSAANVRTREIVNGPNFDVRCERPIARVVYAIENGGFSGAVMPQNIVVGKQAQAVAEFVAKYAGRQAPQQIGIVPCVARPIGALPSPTATTATPPAATTTTPTTATTSTTAASGQKTQARSKKTARH
jgi:mono/diheme cytochrome c family protein